MFRILYTQYYIYIMFVCVYVSVCMSCPFPFCKLQRNACQNSAQEKKKLDDSLSECLFYPE